MLKIGNLQLIPDGDTLVVQKVGVNKKTKEPTYSNIYYVRDLMGGLQAMQRLRDNKAVADATTIQELKDLLTKQHDELIAAVKGLT